MPDEFLTLAELAELSGVEVRTLRSWIAQGVVPGPESVGRNARYARGALARTRAAKAMRDLYGMSLSAIRQDLLAADEGKIEAYAAMAASISNESSAVRSGEGQSIAQSPPSGTSAADYLRNLRGAGVFGGARGSESAASLTAPPTAHSASMSVSAPKTLTVAGPSGSRLSRLAEALERIAGTRPARRKSKGEVRLHIPITPDLELAVRGDHSPEEIARYEQIADLLRAILTGGADHD
jgi:DNA-binding transcriptional MerR regulator